MKNILALCFLSITCVVLSFGQIPRTLSYQGVLTDSSGTPKPDGSYIFTFRLYESLGGGSPVGTQVQTLNVKKGLFNTILDQVLNGLTVDRPYWLAIQVGGGSELSPRIPMTAVAYSLSSLRADTARYALTAPQQPFVDSARVTDSIPNNVVTTPKLLDDAVTSAKILNGTIQFADIGQNGATNGQVIKWNGSSWAPGNDTAGNSGPWQTSGSLVYYNSGNVGIGTTTPTAKMETQTGINEYSYAQTNGSIRLATYLNGSFNSGMIGTVSNNPFQIFTSNLGPVMTVSAGGTGTGKIGIGTVTPQQRLSISDGLNLDQSNLNDGTATNALTFGSSSGEGIASKRTPSGNQFGLDFFTGSANRMSILNTGNVGIGTSGPQYKLHTVNSSVTNDDPAIYGEHAVTDYYGVGVKGVGLYKGVEGMVTTSGSQIYFGVRGEVFQSGAGSKYGVYGTVTGTGAGTKYGVFGTVDGAAAGSKVAVGGEVIGGIGIGVSGLVTANDVNSIGVYGYAPSLGSAVRANGNFTATGLKAFQIDHPLDPANKMLNHYCTEGPEPLNVYSGTVNLDGTGEAWIALPEYFQSINKDFRYQLTPVGASMPNLHIAEEIQGNRFKVGGGVPGKKVSWQVSGTRNDLYAQRAGIPVEVDKTGEKRGKYLVPGLFGMPETMGIYYIDREKVSGGKDSQNARRK